MKKGKKPKRIKALNDTNRIVGWTMLGLTFGYPPCCIGEFIIHNIKGTYKIREKRKLNGTGYVPCMRCNQKSETELLEYIANQRSPDLKAFPEDGY